MKKGLLVIIAIVMGTVALQQYNKVKALEEYMSLPGNTPYKMTFDVSPEGDPVKKVISYKGTVEYWTTDAYIDLQTGEVHL